MEWAIDFSFKVELWIERKKKKENCKASRVQVVVDPAASKFYIEWRGWRLQLFYYKKDTDLWSLPYMPNKPCSLIQELSVFRKHVKSESDR